nr:cell wall synthesis protein kre9 [Quercus suber]
MFRLPLQLLAFASLALGYPTVTAPQAGAAVPATAAITVTWGDTGTPANSQLSTFTLTLYVGGNVPGTDAGAVGPVITTSALVSAGTLTFTLDPAALAAAGELTNGFYFQMISVATDGGTMTTYSDRFSLTGMTGVTGAAYVTGASTVTATTGPAPVNAVANNAAAAGTSTGPEAGNFAIPYNSQTGLIKYAPMQSLPPTKITAKTYTPLFPTSAVTIATTWLLPASVTLTVTDPVTYSVSSMENTASPQSNPTGDMAKFLARWKD